MQNFFKKEGVHHFVTENQTKASIGERSVKTIKMRLHKYMNQFQTFRYLEALPKITNSYNNSYHRSIKMKPNQVSPQNQSLVWATLHKSKQDLKRPRIKLKVGDWVRISFIKKTFDREYHEKWTGEIFKVTSAKFKQGKPVYTLEDYAGETITGTFYPEELQLIVVPEDAVYRIERIIRSRKRRGHPKEYLVKWQNWPVRFNSWVTEDDLQNLPRPRDV